jgi:hypothetical protein
MCSSLERDDQHGGQVRPGHVGALRRQQAVEQLVEAHGLPQPPAEPDVAEAPAALQAKAAQIDGDRFARQRLVKEAGLTLDADEGFRKSPGANAALGIEFTELRHGLLPDAATDAHRAHQPPIGVRLAVARDRGVS